MRYRLSAYNLAQKKKQKSPALLFFTDSWCRVLSRSVDCLFCRRKIIYVFFIWRSRKARFPGVACNTLSTKEPTKYFFSKSEILQLVIKHLIMEAEQCSGEPWHVPLAPTKLKQHTAHSKPTCMALSWSETQQWKRIRTSSSLFFQLSASTRHKRETLINQNKKKGNKVWACSMGDQQGWGLKCKVFIIHAIVLCSPCTSDRAGAEAE